MRRPVGVKGILSCFSETKFLSRRVVAFAMLPFALSRSDSFARCRLGVLGSAGAATVSFISCASEHVDNLGAYTASRPETGVLIRSVFVKYQSTSVEQTEEESRTANREGTRSSRRHRGILCNSRRRLGQLLSAIRAIRPSGLNGLITFRARCLLQSAAVRTEWEFG